MPRWKPTFPGPKAAGGGGALCIPSHNTDLDFCCIGCGRPQVLLGKGLDSGGGHGLELRRGPTQKRGHRCHHVAGQLPVSQKFRDVLPHLLSQEAHRSRGLNHGGSALGQGLLAIGCGLRARHPEAHNIPFKVGHAGQDTGAAVEKLADFALICDELPFLLEKEEEGSAAAVGPRELEKVVDTVQGLLGEFVADLLLIEDAGRDPFGGEGGNQFSEGLVHEFFKDEANGPCTAACGHSTHLLTIRRFL